MTVGPGPSGPGVTGSDPAWPDRGPDWRHDAPDPPDAFPVPFAWTDGLALVVISIITQIVAAGFVATAGYSLEDAIPLLVMTALSQLLTIGVGLSWLRLRNSLSWRLLGPVRPSGRHVWIGLGIGVSGYVIVTLLVLLASALFGEFAPPNQPVLEQSLTGPLATAFGVLVAVLLAPVVEEFVFRGVLFQALRQRIGLWPAIGISSIVFGLLHLLAPLYAVVLTILGFWLAAAFHRTGSIVVPIVGHATFNAIALALASMATRVTA